MALRPIDNTLPIAPPERPKKQLKVSTTSQKQTLTVPNDENQVPLPQSTDATIDYIASEGLKPIPDPEFKIQGVIEGLHSKDWIKVCESLNSARSYAIYHSSLLLPSLEKLLLVVVKAMKNPRSALCKTSIMVCCDVFNAFGEKLLDLTSDAFDNLLLQLLLKASQDKRFVCEEAERALNSLVTSMSALPLLRKFQRYVSHANLRVRAKAAVSICNSVSKMGLEEMEEFGVVDLVRLAAELLNDRLPEAREAARNVVISVYKAYTQHEEEQNQEKWQSFCQSNLSPICAQSIVKIVSP